MPSFDEPFCLLRRQGRPIDGRLSALNPVQDGQRHLSRPVRRVETIRRRANFCSATTDLAGALMLGLLCGRNPIAREQRSLITS
jgi:hypothetical protein